MLSAQPTDLFLKDIEGYFRAGIGATPFVGLFTNNPTLSRASLITDMTEPTFTGYARAMPTPAALEIDGSGNYLTDYNAITFQPSAAVSPSQTVKGYFFGVTITSVDHLLLAEYLANPKVFAAATDALDLVLQIMWRNALQWGGLAFAG